MPGSARKLIENGSPGAGNVVGVVPVRLAIDFRPFASVVSTNVGS